VTSHKIQAKSMGDMPGYRPLATDPAAHTIPCRLSVVAGEKMNQLADFENRKSQIANLKSPDGPMARSQVPYGQGKAADLQNRSALPFFGLSFCPPWVAERLSGPQAHPHSG
jgi:hypothetical protein